MEDKWQRLTSISHEVMDLIRASAVLDWDQQTHMPSGGSATRAEQLATLRRLAHERMTSSEVGDLLSALESDPNALSDPFRAAFLREVRRRYDQFTKVPSSLVAEMVRVTSNAMGGWIEARRKGDFNIFKPHLTRIVELNREQADALGYTEHRYDALLDIYEPGATRSDLTRVFSELRGELVSLLQSIVPKVKRVDDSLFRKNLDAKAQLEFVNHVVKQIGFDYERGRMDLSEHPFTTAFASSDVRLTTRVDENDLRMALYSAIHEAGHGIYEQGIPMQFARTPLDEAPSLGLHESQSRMWENVIARSREFWTYFLPTMNKMFPGSFDDVDVEQVYRAVNRVEPSLIRTEADEVTYNLHIMLRYELEQAMIEGSLAIGDLPDVWNAKMEEYLTIRPPSVVLGVLQDVHWSLGSIGYFPTYTLGTVLSVQLYDAARKDHPGIPQEFASGKFDAVHSWMQKHIYDSGSMYSPKELLQRVTGTGYETGPYLAYIKEKYTELYDL